MAESMQGLKRTHRCGELSAADAGRTVTIMGWVQKNRNKGGLDICRCAGTVPGSSRLYLKKENQRRRLIEKAAKPAGRVCGCSDGNSGKAFRRGQ